MQPSNGERKHDIILKRLSGADMLQGILCFQRIKRGFFTSYTIASRRYKTSAFGKLKKKGKKIREKNTEDRFGGNVCCQAAACQTF
jgi:hypothetical protein